MSALNPRLPGQTSPAAVNALCQLLESYLDHGVPVPQELLDLLPQDAFAAGTTAVPSTPAWSLPACFSPRYSAPTPTASMRKLGPVACHAVAKGLCRLCPPEPVDPARLRRLHDPTYVDAFLKGQEPLASVQGWPWTPAIRDGVLAINGGQLLGAQLALEHGLAANIAQGFHHADYEAGGAFCTFNGLALVAQEFPDQRVFVLDCDEHGGNGTADFVSRLPNLFNFSIHGTPFGMFASERNCRRTLKPVTLDFGPYRRALQEAFAEVERWRPGLILYQAGADPHLDDPLGTLGMTTEQMFERDRIVFDFCRRKQIPVLFVLAGGYQEPIQSCLVPLHLNTFRAARDCYA
jgi:acetoin utilization deacetylase AcuC-like enzyme